MPLYEWLFAPPGRGPRPGTSGAPRSPCARRSTRTTPACWSPTTAGELVGFCTAYQDIHSVRFGYRAWVEDLAVDPDRRSQGIGKALLDAAKAWARERGATHLELDSRRGAHRRPPLLRARGRRVPLDQLRLGALGSPRCAGRIVLFGATGYTGRLTAEAWWPAATARCSRARTEQRRGAGGRARRRLETAVADVADPASVRALLEPGDVIVATVGPFARWGDAAAEAAIDAGARYLDSTGEPAFIRRVFERFGPQAPSGRGGAGDRVRLRLGPRQPRRRAGPARGRRGGDAGRYRLLRHRRPRRDERRHPRLGGRRDARALVRLARRRSAPSAPPRGCARSRPAASRGQAISVGASEHFTLPRIHPGLREVNVYLGWFGSRLAARCRRSRRSTPAITKIPGVKAGIERADRRFVEGSTGGPDAEATAPAPARAVVAIAYGPGGEELAWVEVRGRQRLRRSPARRSPGARRPPPPAGSRRPARSDRRRRSGSTRSRPAAPRPGSPPA